MIPYHEPAFRLPYPTSLFMNVLSRNYFKGVDIAMKTTTRNMLAVPVISRSHGKDEGKVIAVSSSDYPTLYAQFRLLCTACTGTV